MKTGCYSLDILDLFEVGVNFSYYVARSSRMCSKRWLLAGSDSSLLSVSVTRDLVVTGGVCGAQCAGLYDRALSPCSCFSFAKKIRYFGVMYYHVKCYTSWYRNFCTSLDW